MNAARRVVAGSPEHAAVLAAPTARRPRIDAASRVALGSSVERDAILCRTRTAATEASLLGSWNDDRRARLADGTWIDLR